MDPTAATSRPGATRSLLTPHDLWLFGEGSHFRLWDKLGCHPATVDGEAGAFFAVWAPNARHVGLLCDGRGWQRPGVPLRPLGSSGVWEAFVPGVRPGERYKYHVASRHGGYAVDKADPFGQRHELPPATASVVWSPAHVWGDAAWLQSRAARNALDAPLSIYEVHLGSFRRVPEEGNRPLTYRELAPALADHVLSLGFTHVELLPVLEHPFGGSWGYQATGYFAPTARWGDPDDFAWFVDHLHQRGLGVILDWAPAHFPADEHGPAFFDGTHLYEHDDPRQRVHPDWNSSIFNHGRHEVASFLISSALFWLDRYHLDGLRVDAVASMLYLDYSRKEGEWIPNEHGGRENLDAIAFLRRFNEAVYGHQPGVQTIAEESTAWPLVSRPVYVGGLGFGLKWDMGWMHDTLDYLSKDPIHRSWHHERLTFRQLYAGSENYVLPLSHDEVVHGKGSLLAKMPGDDWQKFANLRLLLASQWGQQGKKLLFMGAELAAWDEWDHESSLPWHLLAHERHQGVAALVRRLNELLREHPALHRRDCRPGGFEWVDANDRANSVVSWLRRGDERDRPVLVVGSHTPVPRHNYRVGVPSGGTWTEILNTDAKEYGGSGQGNQGAVEASPLPAHGRPWSLNLVLPPLAMVWLIAE